MEPRVTIGLPVYNGENYLAEAIESVLGQTYADFELVISDNGSTDATQIIGEEYASRDDRVRYFRSGSNLGAAWNYNRTVDLARGEYFRWLAHDDMMAPELLEKSVAVMDAQPELSLCTTWVADVDSHGTTVVVKHLPALFFAQDATIRFRAMTDRSYSCEAVFGLMRRETLLQTSMIADYVDSDRTLIAELGLNGPFHEIPEALFLHRQHESRFVKQNRTLEARAAWFNPEVEGKLIFPVWRQLGELWAAIGRSPISLSERVSCYAYMFKWLGLQRNRVRRQIFLVVRHFAPASLIEWRSSK